MKKKLLILIILCGLVPLLAVEVLNEDFESGFIPSGWTQEYISGESNWQINSGGMNDHPPAAHSGNFNAWFFDSSIEGNTTRLISPELSLTTHSKLEFWYAMDDWVNYQDYLRVYYRTAPDSEWVLLREFEEPVMEWEECVLDLPEPSSNYSICFEAEAYWGYGICLDDIIVHDCIINILVWDNDNNSDYNDPQSGTYYTCENSITQSLIALGLDFELTNTLPTRLDDYDIVLIELGIYCVG